jgi:hypothetical protein
MIQLAAEAPAVLELHRQDRDDRELLEHIGQQVIGRLGRPRDLHRIVVKPLWDTYYRVNVICQDSGQPDGISLLQYRIADSFFVLSSPEGGIIRTEPEIVKKYE